MAGVKGVMKLVRQVLGNWRVGKNCELVLSCNTSVMIVTMSADLGIWFKPTIETWGRGHQGTPWRRAGLRRLEKRAAERAAAEQVAAPAEQAEAMAEQAPSPAAQAAELQLNKRLREKTKVVLLLHMVVLPLLLVPPCL